MPDAGNNSESEYFASWFGAPELTRCANWDGREEPLFQIRNKEPWELALDKLDNTVRGMLDDTIDIDYEIVD